MSEQKNSAIHLRPRFKLEYNESQQDLIAKFKDNLKLLSCLEKDVRPGRRPKVSPHNSPSSVKIDIDRWPMVVVCVSAWVR